VVEKIDKRADVEAFENQNKEEQGVGVDAVQRKREHQSSEERGVREEDSCGSKVSREAHGREEAQEWHEPHDGNTQVPENTHPEDTALGFAVRPLAAA
jgi:hypothetical protein